MKMKKYIIFKDNMIYKRVGDFYVPLVKKPNYEGVYFENVDLDQVIATFDDLSEVKFAEE